MEEAKYCEDIIPKIKASLQILGYTNEHNRLGHFETKVPADVFFGLGRDASDVKFFGLQFKSPKKKNRGVSWNLTHTSGQYESIMSMWPNLICYCLPWYTDPIDSPKGLELSAFLQPTRLPKNHVDIIRDIAPLPAGFIARLVSFLYTGKKDADDLTRAISMHGLQRVIDAIDGCNMFFPESARMRCNLPLIEDKDAYQKLIDQKVQEEKVIAKKSVRELKVLGISTQTIKEPKYPGILELLEGKTHISHWNQPPDKLLIRELVTVSKKDPDRTLSFTSKLRILGGYYLTESNSFTNMAGEIDRIQGETEFLNWDKILSMIEKGGIGTSLHEINVDAFKSVFQVLFPSDEDGLMLWYSHIKKIFYAIESRRLTTGERENVIGTVSDPLTAALSLEIRREIYNLAKLRGIPAPYLLADIVKKYLRGDTDGG